jgi:hypothetical protein
MKLNPPRKIVLLALVLPELVAGALDRDDLRSVRLAPGVRQLFLDDFLLGDIDGVERVIHQPRRYERNPVIRPDLPTDGTIIEMRDGPSWDADEKVWKAWYMAAGDAGGCAFARSRDGIYWEKPVLGVVERGGNTRNNLVGVRNEPKAFLQHVFLDPGAPPERRYKAMIGPRDRRAAVSADGFTFDALDVPPIPSQDESHLTWDELQRQYILTVKHNGPFGRAVYLCLSRDFEKWSDPELIYHADALDQRLGEEHIRRLVANPKTWHPPVNSPREYNTEIYNMPVFVYEGLYVGLPTYFESSGKIPPPRGNQDGTNSVKLVCSRNLRVWTRVGDRKHFIPIAELGTGGTDTGQILAASRPLRMGDELWFYYSGLDVRYRPDGTYRGGIHLAKLRRDGFVSLRGVRGGGFVETRPVRVGGGRLHVNADAARGEVAAEITDAGGRTVLAGWGRDRCAPVRGDRLAAELRWEGRALRELAGQTVRIRFHVRDADLYAFWLEP